MDRLAALLFIPRLLVRRRYFLAFLFLAMVAETIHNIYSLRVTHPSTLLDEPFHIDCRAPKVDTPKENAAILMLSPNSDADGAVKTIKSLEEQFNKRFHYPMVFLNDQQWEPEFMDKVSRVASGKVQFGLIEQRMWGYPDWVDQLKARTLMDTQARAGVLYAGNESYHHMCRFYSG